NTLSAGLGGLIAFLVVAGIGALLFFTVFNKKDKVEPLPTPPVVSPTISIPPTTIPPTTIPPTTAPPTTAPPTTAPPTTAAPSPTQSQAPPPPTFRNLLRVFFCKKLLGGSIVGGTIVGATPSGCSNPVEGGVNLRRTVPGFFVMVSALDFEPRHKITAAVGIPGTRIIVQQGSFTTQGVAGAQRAFLPVLAPSGGFPPVTLAVIVLVDGQPIQFQVGGRNIIPEVNLR
ncbi:MAG: hypothetical protein ACJ77A_17280, partial [Actinomycetota bacterium]